MFDTSVKGMLRLAVEIEEKGERFYRSLAEHASDEELQELFLYLAVEEEKHKDIFNHMITCINEADFEEDYPEKHFDFLNDFAENSVFNLGGLEEKPAVERDFKSALNLALQRELESIAFYQELKDFIEEEQHHLIDKIIREERQHFSKLSQVKEILCAA